MALNQHQNQLALIWKEAYQNAPALRCPKHQEPNMSESSHVPSVEERLRNCLVLVAVLRRCVLLADESPHFCVPGFTPQEILRRIPAALVVLRTEIEAIKRVLPASLGGHPKPAINRHLKTGH
jgi:hypothetical protein